MAPIYSHSYEITRPACIIYTQPSIIYSVRCLYVHIHDILLLVCYSFLLPLTLCNLLPPLSIISFFCFFYLRIVCLFFRPHASLSFGFPTSCKPRRQSSTLDSVKKYRFVFWDHQHIKSIMVAIKSLSKTVTVVSANICASIYLKLIYTICRGC